MCIGHPTSDRKEVTILGGEQPFSWLGNVPRMGKGKWYDYELRNIRNKRDV